MEEEANEFRARGDGEVVVQRCSSCTTADGEMFQWPVFVCLEVYGEEENGDCYAGDTIEPHG